MKKATLQIRAGETDKALAFITKRLEVCTKPQMLTIQDYTETRRKKANRYMWLCHGVWHKTMGPTPDETHWMWKEEILIGMYKTLDIKINYDGNDIDATEMESIINASCTCREMRLRLINIYFKTRDLSVKVFYMYVNEIVRSAATHGVDFPSPSFYGIEGV